MSIRYTRTEIIERLNKEIQTGRALFMTNCGLGLTGRIHEENGTDIICISPTSWWRMRGFNPVTAFTPYSDMNQIIFSLLPEVKANVKETPLIALCGPHNPLLPHEELLEKLWDNGISGVNPAMVYTYDPPFIEKLDHAGIGWQNEVDFTRKAHDKNMFSFCYAYTPEQAKILTAAGADVISSHVGSTVGGFYKSGAPKSMTLEEATELSQEIFEAARQENPDVILFAHGGPLNTPEAAQYVLKNTLAQGFTGGSVAERVPIEDSVALATQQYKKLTVR